MANTRKELTDEEKQEVKRRAALTVLKTHKTLLDLEFWGHESVDAELFEELRTAIDEMSPNIREAKAQRKLKELEMMGVDTSDIKIKFKK